MIGQTFEQHINHAFEFFADYGFERGQNNLALARPPCCQSCGWAEVAENEIECGEALDNVVFYHDQDASDLRAGEVFVAWKGDGDSIKSYFERCELNVAWSGDDSQRMKVSRKGAAA